jgi:hypothetical protein
MKSLLFCLSLLAFGTQAMAGVDSSGGSIGGSLQISTGFAPGAFSISVFSPKSGVLATALKYFVAAGAKENVHTSGSDYEVENNSAFLINSETNAPEGNEYYQLNLRLPFEDLYEISTSPQYSSFAFRGPLAAILYQAMDVGGAKVVGQTLDPQTGQVIGKLLMDESLFCQKSPEGSLRGGTWCRLTTHSVK